MQTKFILDSGNPQEYQTTANLLKEQGRQLWGSTTNPSLIAKSASERLKGKKLSMQEAFELQKEIIYEILEIVPGAVSAEVYADLTTTADEMIEQGRQIASWNKRIVVKLPTTVAGFEARTQLRSENIVTNNTLVFSQQQIYAICLHEHLTKKEFSLTGESYPSFISPFVGRLDDIGEDGLTLVENGMELKRKFPEDLWMLTASVRNSYHLEKAIELESELITAPAGAYKAWLMGQKVDKPQTELTRPDLWQIPEAVKEIDSLTKFFEALENKTLDIDHSLSEKGIIRFAEDWQALLH